MKLDCLIQIREVQNMYAHVYGTDVELWNNKLSIQTFYNK